MILHLRFGAIARTDGANRMNGHLARLDEAVSASTRDERQARPLPGDRDQPHRVLPGGRGVLGPVSWTSHLPPSAVLFVSDVRFRRSAQRLQRLKGRGLWRRWVEGEAGLAEECVDEVWPSLEAAQPGANHGFQVGQPATIRIPHDTGLIPPATRITQARRE